MGVFQGKNLSKYSTAFVEPGTNFSLCHCFVNAGAGQPLRVEFQESSHAPKDWTLMALAGLRDGMKQLNISRFSLPLVGNSGLRHIDKVENPEIFMYLAKRVTLAATDMSGPVNGQAVIAKISKLQRHYTCSEQGFQDWLSRLQLDVNLQRHAEASRRQGADAARAESEAVRLKPEQVIQTLLEDADLMSNVMGIILDNPTLNEQLSARLTQEASSGHACDSEGLQFAGMSLRALEQLPDVKHKSMLVKLIKAFTENGQEVPDWPMMVNLINDFSTMLGAQDLRNVHLSEDSLQFYDTLASLVGKGAFNFLRGYGQSSADQDDDGGKA